MTDLTVPRLEQELSPESLTYYLKEIKDFFRKTPELVSELKKENLQEVYRFLLQVAISTKDDDQRAVVITNLLAMRDIFEALKDAVFQKTLTNISRAVWVLVSGFEFQRFTWFPDFQAYFKKDPTPQWTQVRLKAFLQTLSDKNILLGVNSQEQLPFLQALLWAKWVSNTAWTVEMVEDFVTITWNLEGKHKKAIKKLFLGLAWVKASPDAVKQGASEWVLWKYATPRSSGTHSPLAGNPVGVPPMMNRI